MSTPWTIDRLLLVATDRVSAFDVVMAETDPDEGRGADADQRLVVRASSKASCRIT